MKVREMPIETRPREKALEYGLSSLCDFELIAIILRSGYQGVSVTSLAQQVLDKYPLDKLSNISIDDLIKIKGIKEAKALELLVCFELSKRVSLYIGKREDVINNPKALLNFIKSEIGSLSNEQFLVVCLNTKNVIIKYKIMFIGTVDVTVVHPRDIFKFAIKNNATRIICAHNHPSGDVTPSKQDIEITKVIKETGDMVGIPLLDHIIVSNSEVYSILGSLSK
ncbi:MAG TPA: DNA repair protein RadC [Erysipelotrichaceae bacterium]|nr:DNA repair protein RadC [Erysipelotrichaceae bacterium]